jgi:hypothetical protein
MQPLTPDAILDAFDAIDRPVVSLPDVTNATWSELDYLAWRHPTAAIAYMVVPLPERHVGMVLRLTETRRAAMCDLCYGYDREAGTMMAMVDNWERPRSAHGLCICSDFGCSEGVRGLKFMYRMGETIPVGRRIERLQAHLARFSRLITGLEPTAS